MKKISLSNIKEAMGRDELRAVAGGCLGCGGQMYPTCTYGYARFLFTDGCGIQVYWDSTNPGYCQF